MADLAGREESASSSQNTPDMSCRRLVSPGRVEKQDLIKNRIFVLLSLGKAMEYLHMIGASGFVPTFIEHQFVLSKKTATLIAGIVLIPASAIGYILGGLIASNLKLSGRGLMRLIMISSGVSFILFVVIMILHCDPVPFAGLNEDYDGTGKIFNLTAPCNDHCQCLTSFYSPICGRDGVSYFSSCFAGCMRSKITNQIKTYYNCSCINVGLVSVDEDNEFIDASDGKCDSNCDKLHFSIAIFFSMVVFSGLSGIPGELIILRGKILNDTNASNRIESGTKKITGTKQMAGKIYHKSQTCHVGRVFVLRLLEPPLFSTGLCAPLRTPFLPSPVPLNATAG
ncbi:solute carrier organic anion transporter family member 6A1 [Sorex araneus]|uniref:solute carrier organic anion transporter family member 6A1 n=1 Tax=Sorex araneus TaxID=42254 RepID=UPI002433FB5B|nr:solute carrier organic anion transporter family member 6A1 [Sorex araneus]